MANRVGNTAPATEVIPAGHAALTPEEELESTSRIRPPGSPD